MIERYLSPSNVYLEKGLEPPVLARQGTQHIAIQLQATNEGGDRHCHASPGVVRRATVEEPELISPLGLRSTTASMRSS